MGNLRERNLRQDEAAKVGREKAKDEPSLNEEIDKHGHHATGLQLGNIGNQEGIAPLTEQEKRNRGESHAPSGGEAAWREGKHPGGVATRPSESQPEVRRESLPATAERSSKTGEQTRPSHP
ncbi:MAG: hypothetical protein HYV09_14205 [Deltaproteobacteria bacterium]|nr:hypothetical protein [Deltaproteobacteria bacterium]